MRTDALDGGFADTVLDAQAAFRAIMDAMARPATVHAMPSRATPPAPLDPVAGAVAYTLADGDTPLWLDPALDTGPVRAWLSFHTGARFAPASGEAIFALVGEPRAMPPLDRFAQGTQDYPDRSTTLVLQVDAFEGGAPLAFRGPGIVGTAELAPVGLPRDFAGEWAGNRRRFPRGVDLILVSGSRLACLPRSARLVPAEG